MAKNFNADQLGSVAHRKNVIINGDMSIAQRGVTFVNPNAIYSLDRWLATIGTGVTATLTQQEQATEPRYFMRWAQSVAGSALSNIQQRIEGARTLEGQTITFSFFAQVASGSETVTVFIAQQFGTGGSPSGQVNLAAQNDTVTTTLQRFEFRFDLPSTSSKTFGTAENDSLIAIIQFPNTVHTMEIFDVQVEAGVTATDYDRRSAEEELTACLRYYWRHTAVQTQGIFFNGHAATTIDFRGVYTFPVPMRGAPTFSFSGAFFAQAGGFTVAYTGLALFAQDILTGLIFGTPGAGLTLGHGGFCFASNDAAAFLSFDAEL